MLVPAQPKWWAYSYHLSNGATWGGDSSFNTMGHTVDAAMRGAINRASHGELEIIKIYLKVGGDTHA